MLKLRDLSSYNKINLIRVPLSSRLEVGLIIEMESFKRNIFI